MRRAKAAQWSGTLKNALYSCQSRRTRRSHPMDNRHDGLKFSLYSSFLKGNAKVPQMPETSLRLRKLLASEHASLEQVTRLLHSNPPLAAYLLQFAETPMLRNLRQGVNLQEVIARLGMQRLNNLVLSFAIQHLFTSQDPALQKVFRT
eukprot:gene689-871_t